MAINYKDTADAGAQGTATVNKGAIFKDTRANIDRRPKHTRQHLRTTHKQHTATYLVLHSLKRECTTQVW